MLIVSSAGRGVQSTQHQGDVCRNACCAPCSIYPCDCDNIGMDLICAACCSDPASR